MWGLKGKPTESPPLKGVPTGPLFFGGLKGKPTESPPLKPRKRHNHRCPFWLIWLKNRGPRFAWWFNQLPGPSIFPKSTPMNATNWVPMRFCPSARKEPLCSSCRASTGTAGFFRVALDRSGRWQAQELGVWVSPVFCFGDVNKRWFFLVVSLFKKNEMGALKKRDTQLCALEVVLVGIGERPNHMPKTSGPCGRSGFGKSRVPPLRPLSRFHMVCDQATVPRHLRNRERQLVRPR